MPTTPAPSNTLDLGTMPACVQLSDDNIAAAARMASKLKYAFAKFIVGGQSIFVAASGASGNSPAEQLINQIGLRRDRFLPARDGMISRPVDTAKP